MPNGGGALKGISETFAANPVTGTATITVPITTTAGRAGPGAGLALQYDSGAGAGPFGLGWSLTLPDITRKTDKGLPTYRDDDDEFVLGGADDLVPALTRNANDRWVPDATGERVVGGVTYDVQRYLPRTEGAFARIERWTARLAHADCFWRTISADNVTSWFGLTSESRITDPADTTRIFRWSLCQRHDDKGNAVVYRYRSEDSVGVDVARVDERHRDDPARSTNHYLSRVLYGSHAPYLPALTANGTWPQPPGAAFYFEVVLDYGDHHTGGDWPVRPDPFSSYRAGFELRTYRLCRRVLMVHHFDGEPGVGRNCLVSSTDFTYAENATGTTLRAIGSSAYRRTASGNGYDTRSLPPLELTYSDARLDGTVRELDAASVENAPAGVDGASHRWIDLDGNGLTGVLVQQADGWSYKPNVSPLASGRSRASLGPMERLGTMPSKGDLASGVQLLDLAGDGHLDVASFEGPARGFYERAGDGWKPLTPFASLPNIDWDDPNLRFVDLTGNGRADAVVTERDIVTWYRSLGEAGFAEATRVRREQPGFVFNDGTQSIHLADMSGDGLTDVVRIRNGEVAYWPNLGYGRFGEKVTMRDAPWFDRPDDFDNARVRLADVDGTGTADILYLGRNGIDVYFNRCGNGWSANQTLVEFPRTDDLSAVSAVDLLGNGTACLVWSTPLPRDRRRPLRYIDLMGGQKPHLLTRVVNNLGASTEFEYAPSTKFFLADKLAGRPWATRLPFPVHVVERVTRRDVWRKSAFSSTYAYHHGHYDGGDREFRGFGRVDHVDVESFDVFAAGNVASPYVTDDKTLYQPPVKTISWYHTGTGTRNPYEDEYAIGVAPRPVSIDVDDVPVDEHVEALRACKGSVLRQEVYELDVDALHLRGEHVPLKLLSTSTQTYAVQLVQPRGDNRHPVSLVTEVEDITAQHDFDLGDANAQPDPRIVQTVNLSFDVYGHPLETVAVAYPRRVAHAEPDLSSAQLATIRATQAELHVTYTTTAYTHDVLGADRFRMRLPYDVTTYDVSGMQLAAGGKFTTYDLRTAALATVAEILYHEHPIGGVQKRAVERVRTLYLLDSLAGPAAVGTLSPLGITYETYQLAMTPELLGAVFDARLDDVVDGTTTARQKLDNPAASGYLRDQEDRYWLRSGTAGFAPNAAQHFYTATQYTDPFGAVTTVQYDSRDLFTQATTDAIGNQTRVETFDYRVMTPTSFVDENDNRSAVALDILGLVVASANLAKGGADDLGGFTAAVTDPPPADVRAFCDGAAFDEATARGWLRNATSRFVHHFGDSTRPAAVCSITREIHAAQPGGDASPLQVTLECSDGGGGVLMTKRRAEPEAAGGPARWIVDGKTVVNNKGKPVKQYEPYFRPDFGCETVEASGVATVLYYDAADRTVRTDFADGTYVRLAITPWSVTTYDPNDTVLEAGNAWYEANAAATAGAEQRRAAALAADHAGTPSTSYLDTVGRDAVAITRLPNERHLSLTKLDAEGKALWIRDQRGNPVTQYIKPPMADGQQTDPAGAFVPCYDLAGNALFSHSMDGGDRWTLPDANGEPIAAWTANERQDDAGIVVVEQRVFSSTYDAARRPTHQWLTINRGAAMAVERFAYGESIPVADAKARNLRGCLLRHEDASGRTDIGRRDESGKELEITRRLVNDVVAAVANWQGNGDANLEAEAFTQMNEYDALGRITRCYQWHQGTGSRVAVAMPHYNERGLLSGHQLVVRATKTASSYQPDPAHPPRSVIAEIVYDAKGQQMLVRRDNGTTTTYDYDPARYRLVRLRTTRPGRVLQDLNYTYDAAGNVTAIHDDAYEPTFFANQQVMATSRFAYDAMYRLVEATGRETRGASGAPSWQEPTAPGVTFPVTNVTLRNYTQRYRYDAAGNIVELRHEAAGNGAWTRHYEHAAGSNRLARTWLGGNVVDAIDYRHDTHGNVLNLLKVPAANQLRWDYRDLLRATDLGGGGWAYSTYDSANRRTRRVVTNQAGGVRWERTYLDGWERYRRYAGAVVVEEIESLHVAEGDRRFLLVDDILQTDNAALAVGPLFRYQYGNHLDSTSLEADEQAQVISYEEYHPYGTTAYRAADGAREVPPSRFRYGGAERDAESGLYCQGARYYAPWLARWTSADPSGTADGPNRYSYARGSPAGNTDRSGLTTDPKASVYGQTGRFNAVKSSPDFIREHIVPTASIRHDLQRAFDKEVDPKKGLAKIDAKEIEKVTRGEAEIIQSPNAIAKEKTGKDRGQIAKHRKGTAGPRTLFLEGMREQAEAHERHTANKLTKAERARMHRTASSQMGTQILKGELIANEMQKNGGQLPTNAKDIVRARNTPSQATSSGGGAKVTTFTLGDDDGGASSFMPKKSGVEKLKTMMAPKGGGRGGSSMRGAGAGLVGTVGGMVVSSVAGEVAGSALEGRTARNVTEVVSAVAEVGVEYVAKVGVPTAMVTAQVGVTTVTTGAATAFGATTLSGVAAGGTAAVGVAGVAVVAAGAAGYAVGTAINKVAVEPLVDMAAPGSGAVGDWYYRTFLK